MSEGTKKTDSVKKLEAFMRENQWTPETLFTMARVLVLEERIRRHEDSQSSMEKHANKAGQCERWLAFLEEAIGDEKGIDRLQEFFGYCLTEKVFLARALFVYGPEGTGKSAALRVLQELVGRENTSFVPLDDLENQYQRVCLYQKAVNFAYETRAEPFENPYFKAILAGDLINAELGDGCIVFHPTCKLVVFSNHVPQEIIESPALRMRILPIKFSRRPSRPTPRLCEKLRAELDGIRLWAQAGLERLKEQGGFTPSGRE